MGLTLEQIQMLWSARMRLNNPRYKFMSPANKAIFNAELDTIFLETQNELVALYGNDTIDYNTLNNINPDGISDYSIPLQPPPTGTRSIIIGTNAQGNPISQTITNPANLYISGPDSTGKYNLNFYSGSTTIPDPTQLSEVWQYDSNPLQIGISSSLPPTNKYATRLADRFQNNINSWDSLQPDQYFLTILTPNATIWTNKLDPTQTYKWINGTIFASNGLPLDMGLNNGVYNPNHPELINNGWSLESHSGNKWIWSFNYSDPSYRITIIKQTNNTYLHSESGAIISPNDWYNMFIGTSYGI